MIMAWLALFCVMVAVPTGWHARKMRRQARARVQAQLDRITEYCVTCSSRTVV